MPGIPFPDLVTDAFLRLVTDRGIEPGKILTLSTFHSTRFERVSKEITLDSCVILFPVTVFAVNDAGLSLIKFQLAFG